MEYAFSFNARMLLMLGVVLALLMALSFGLGMLYGDSHGASPQAGKTAAAPMLDKKSVKEETK